MTSSGGTRARPARYFPRVPRNDASAPPVLSFFPRRSRGSSEREEPSWFVKFKTISKILLNFSFSFFREIWIERLSQIELSNYWIFLTSSLYIWIFFFYFSFLFFFLYIWMLLECFEKYYNMEEYDNSIIIS